MSNDEVSIVKKPPLDPSLYQLDPSALYLWPPNQDLEQLRAHILRVQAKAYEVYGYPCIHSFRFLSTKIHTMPAFHKALETFRGREDAILLDMGCCFGTDTRKAVLLGWPVNRIIASDIQPAFWDYGHELFQSTPDSFPAAFIPGDIFSPELIPPPHKPAPPATTTSAALPDNLTTLTSFHPLRARLSAIHASAFFHLFTEQRQLQAATILASLLSPEPGSVIFGRHVANLHPGPFLPAPGLVDGPADQLEGEGHGEVKLYDKKAFTGRMYCHSPESWKEMWERDVFGEYPGAVQVKAALREINRPEYGVAIHVMTWSVTRLSVGDDT